MVASSEAVPFAKTGGLADVCGTLPSRVASMGHQAAVIMPAFMNDRLDSVVFWFCMAFLAKQVERSADQ